MTNILTKKRLYLNNIKCTINELKLYINHLPSKSKTIMGMYFGLENTLEKPLEELEKDYSFSNIAVTTNSTKEEVEQITKEYIKVLQNSHPKFTNLDKVDFKIEEFVYSVKNEEEIYVSQMDDTIFLIENYIENYNLKEIYINKLYLLLNQANIRINPNRYSQKRERELISIYQKNKDEKALTELIDMHKKLLHKMAKGYYTISSSFEDVYQEVLIGFIKGVKTFDLSYDYRLMTHAKWHIMHNMRNDFKTNDQIIRVPSNTYDKLIKIRRSKSELLRLLNREPTVKELSNSTGLPENVIKELLDFNYEIISLSTFINEKEEGIEKIIPSSLVNIEQEAIDNVFKQELLNKINTLNDSEKKVLINKYGFDERGEKTYSEVGRELNLSRQRVHQIEQKALSKLSTDSSLKK